MEAYLRHIERKTIKTSSSTTSKHIYSGCGFTRARGSALEMLRMVRKNSSLELGLHQKKGKELKTVFH